VYIGADGVVLEACSLALALSTMDGSTNYYMRMFHMALRPECLEQNTDWRDVTSIALGRRVNPKIVSDDTVRNNLQGRLQGDAILAA
jgi:hypothetical protein